MPPRRGAHPSRDGRGPADPEEDRRRALALVRVSRETEARLELYVELIARWQRVKNLVGPSALDRIWTRHIADSAQLLALVPDAKHWADMGSGAGFPGMVTAIQLCGQPGATVHLIESNGRKCAFLREAARQCGAPAVVHNARVEDVLSELANIEVITARAVAPLPRLLEMGKVPLSRGARGLFLKSEGEIGASDLENQDFRCRVLPSKTSKEGRIVLVSARDKCAHPTSERTGTEGCP